jgi:hypothetical protein
MNGMRERWNTIRTGALIAVFSFIGLWEYVQLVKYFDLPQMMLIIPIVGALAMICLKKKSFIVLAGTILLASIYQIVAGESNAISDLQTNAASIAVILLECLSILIVFEMIGIGGGALIRVLLNKKKERAKGILCCVIGVVLVFGPYLALFHNPLYPLTARKKLTAYAEENFTDYAIAEKKVYYSMQVSEYQCRVAMSDGQIRVIGIDADGNVVQQ